MSTEAGNVTRLLGGAWARRLGLAFALLTLTALLGTLSSASAQADGVVTIKGVVRDGEGNPIAHAGITAISEGQSAGAETGTDGSYSVQVSTGEYRLFMQTETDSYEDVKGLHVTAEIEGLQVSENTTEDFDVPMQVGSIKVKVIDANENPVPEIGVGIQPEKLVTHTQTTQDTPVSYEAGGSNPEGGCTTNNNGECNVRAFADAKIKFSAQPQGSLSASTEGTSTTTGEQATIKLPPVVTIKGVVRDGEGNPIAHAGITAISEGQSAGAETGTDGSYSVQVSTGEYRLFMQTETDSYEDVKGLHVTAEIEGLQVSENTTEDFDVPMQVGSIKVKVIDANENPVPEIGVGIQPEKLVTHTQTTQDTPVSYEAGGSNPEGGCTTNNNGECNVRAFADAKIKFSAQPQGSLSASTEGTSTTTGEQATIKLPPVVTIKGVVRDGEGNPIAHAGITAISEGQSAGAETGTDGSYSVQVSTGEYRLFMQTETDSYEDVKGLHVTAEIEGLQVSENTTEDFDVPMQVGSIKVKVIDANENPVPEIGVGIQPEKLVTHTQTTQDTPVSYEAGGSNPEGGCTTNNNGECNVRAFADAKIKFSAQPQGSLSASTEGTSTTTGEQATIKLISYMRAPQEISFTTSAPSNPNVGSVYLVGLEASSGLPVELSVDPTSQPSACLVNGTTVSFTGTGTCVILASQPGDATYLPASQVKQSIQVTVAKASTVTTLSTTTGSVAYSEEQNEVFKVKTTAAGGGVIPTGTVTVKAGAKMLCTASLSNGTGNCSMGATTEKPGVYSITAKYTGTPRFASSTSGSSTLEVTKTGTATALSMTSATVTFGSEQEETFTVQTTATGQTPTGTVKIQTGAGTLCSVKLSGGQGTCSLKAKTLKLGTYAITATYAGTLLFASSTSSAADLSVE